MAVPNACMALSGIFNYLQINEKSAFKQIDGFIKRIIMYLLFITENVKQNYIYRLDRL